MNASAVTRWRVAGVDDLREVYDATFDEVYRYASRLAGSDRQLAEDLVHDAFVDAARRIGGGDAIEISIGWLYTVVRHRFIDHLRRRSTREQLMIETLAPPEHVDAPVVECDGAALLVGLSSLDRLVLVMHHVDGCSVREVADAIGRSRRATESVLARARERARRMSVEGGR
jgi:RNA polymerase sigma-70 factor (ECF subfamily)